MLLLHSAAIVAAAVLPVLSLPTYTIPLAFKEFLIQNDCTYPEAFEIQKFGTWKPAAGNNASSTIYFGYVDKDTNIQTSCEYNSTSANVAKPGYTPRYACDNPAVVFIWQNGTLTMIERACPGQSGSTVWEASGSVKPALGCNATGCDYPMGDGDECLATNLDINGTFTSLQPSPP